ncbi:4172_t:CDS:1, partial [Diversispora eburnea]
QQQSIISFEIRNFLLDLSVLFLCTFDASNQFIWMPPLSSINKSINNNDDKSINSKFTPFLESLCKIFLKLKLNNNNEDDDEYFEFIIEMIFDKLGFELPLEILIREKNDLEKLVYSKNSWILVLEQRLQNISKIFSPK